MTAAQLRTAVAAVWAAGALAVPVLAGITVRTQAAGDWNTPATWTGSHIPEDTDIAFVDHNVILTNGTANLAACTISAGKTNTFCTTNAILNAQDVTIYGTITHTNNTATNTVSGQWVPNGRVFVACSNLFVDATGQINADTRGYGGLQSGTGSGYGPGGGGSSGGGGYGGRGGSPNGGATNGVAGAPDQPGSGGGNSAGDPAGSGGGLIWIQATQGTVTVNGKISADGAFLSSPGGGTGRGGGGSGGGIYIACKTFAGTNGLMSVVGGMPQRWFPGGGGGGRIAIVTDTNAQAGAPPVSVQYRCAGGLGRDGGGDGLPGTLYVNAPQILPTAWTSRVVSAVLLGFPSWTSTQWAITNCELTFGTRVQVVVSTGISVANATSSTKLAFTNASSLTCGSLSLSNASLYLCSDADTTTATLVVNGNVSMVNTGMLYVYAAMTNEPSTAGAWVNVGGAMSLANGSVVYPYCNPTNGGPVCFTIRNLSISDTNSGFNANGKGFRGTLVGVNTNGLGPGRGTFGQGGAGGGYGGAGGASAAHPGGGTYGSSNSPPIFAGSGGGNGVNGVARGSDGGGVIWIECSGTITLNGYLRASSGALVGTSGNGGGSGGGIYLNCRRIQGTTGSLIADGGNGGDYGGSCDGGGGGGGGRIQVWSIYNMTGGSVTTSVQKGLCVPSQRGYDGNPGTVYWGTLLESGTVFVVH